MQFFLDKTLCIFYDLCNILVEIIMLLHTADYLKLHLALKKKAKALFLQAPKSHVILKICSI